MRKAVLILGVALLAWFGISYGAGSILGLQGSRLWTLRGMLAVIGCGAAGIVGWFYWNRIKEAGAAAKSEKFGGASDDIALLIRDAESKLAAAQQGKGGKLSSLPVIFVLGETGTAKTSTMVNSQLEVELLAGQVYQDTKLQPTRGVNIWYAQRAVFLEAAGSAVSEEGTFTKIARRVQAAGLGSAMGGGAAAPRAALLAVSAEALLQPGARDAMAALARTLRARLAEIAQTLGVNLPVYVLFTKMDKVPFFTDYVGNLKEEEAAQVLGATLPIATTQQGAYAEAETARIGGYFEQLFRALANARPDFLAREHDVAKLPGGYEFPREFRKLRPLLVQFLVDLCRPSQLTVGPFLRGFFFSGVRPIIVNEVAKVPAAPIQRPVSEEVALDATRMFRPDRGQQPLGSMPHVVGTRKIPQWLFLSRLFHSLILADRVALGTSASSTKTSRLRRILLATGTALFLIYGVCLTISFVRNRGLETRVREAAEGIDAAEVAGGVKAAPVESLRKLEALRLSLDELLGFQRNGAGLSYHWGLYTGDELYPRVRRLYFAAFKKVLFGQTQNTMVEALRSLPATPGPAEYGPTYDTLKAYLITTSESARSTREFLSPVLLDRWSAKRGVDQDRKDLAAKQFDFYSQELRAQNPYTATNDAEAVEKGRAYLNQFAGFERVYRAMLEGAAKKNPPVNFNKKFPGSAEVVVNNYDVAGPFTKTGWAFMMDAIKNPRAYFEGEAWVLGPHGAAEVNSAQLAQQLGDRYSKDFITQWRNYFRASSVVKYKDPADAAKKLGQLTGNQSPLLALFSLASQNTAVENPDVKALFQPVQSIVPPEITDRFAGPSNQQYMDALASLQMSVNDAAGEKPVTDVTAGKVMGDAGTARKTTSQAARNFRPDPDGHVDDAVHKLMEDPITSVEALFKGRGKDELNAKGKGFCSQYNALMSKYPFRPDAQPQATLVDVNGIFKKPEGALWALYEGVQKVLVKQGTQYVPAPPAGDVAANPGFVSFFNQAAALSETLYSGNSPEPHFSYSLKPLPMSDIEGVVLTLDGQKVQLSGASTTPKAFVWKGSGNHEAKAAVVMVKGGSELGWVDLDGLWAVFKFFTRADRFQSSGHGQIFEWGLKAGADPLKGPGGKPLVARLELDMGDTPPVFQRGYFSRLGCVAVVAK